MYHPHNEAKLDIELNWHKNFITATIKSFIKWCVYTEWHFFHLLMMQLIIRAAECVTHGNNTFFIFPRRTSSPPLPLTLLPSLQQEYLQAALQDNGAQLPRAKSPVALTNVVSTEQETLCSHIRVKYLLFISAKAKRGDKECNNRESRIDHDGGSEL